jgi:hypothetical protein
LASPNHIYAPLLLTAASGRSLHCWALVDTGCDVTTVNLAVAAKLGVDHAQTRHSINSAFANSSVKHRQLIEPITMACGSQGQYSHTAKFTVLDSPFEVLLGQDMLPKFGMLMSNVPTFFPRPPDPSTKSEPVRVHSLGAPPQAGAASAPLTSVASSSQSPSPPLLPPSPLPNRCCQDSLPAMSHQAAHIEQLQPAFKSPRPLLDSSIHGAAHIRHSTATDPTNSTRHFRPPDQRVAALDLRADDSGTVIPFPLISHHASELRLRRPASACHHLAAKPDSFADRHAVADTTPLPPESKIVAN